MTKYPALLNATLLLPIILISGCSQKFQSVQDTMSLAIFGPDDAVVSPEDVENLPYASMYVNAENGAGAFMVLGYATPSFSDADFEQQRFQLKWLSANNEMIVTESGRVIKTLGLQGGNIVASHAKNADPLALGLLKESTPKEWIRTIDWQPGFHFGYELHSRFERKGQEVMLVNEKLIETVLFLEHVSAPEIGTYYINKFWVEPINGNVIASEQIPAPHLPKLELTVLKPFSGARS